MTNYDITRWQSAVESFVAKRVRRAADREDAVQDCLLALLDARPETAGEVSALCEKTLRRDEPPVASLDEPQTRRDCPLSGQPDEDVWENTTLATEDALALKTAVGILPDAEKRLIYALFFEGVSVREYAELTGREVKDVRRSKGVALAKLRAMLK